MSIFDDLRRLGGKLGVVRLAAPATGTAPAKITTRAVTLAELTVEVAGGAAAGDAPDDDLGRIYAAARLPEPVKGWNVDRLIAVLRGDDCAGLSRVEAQAKVLELLAGDGATAENVVRDALARDRALDAYAAAVRTTLAQHGAKATRRRADIAREIDALKAEAERLAREDGERRERWKSWWARKRGAEEAMAWAVGHLLDQPVLSVDAHPPELGDA